MTEQTIEITSRELAELVNPVIPFASMEDWHPVLNAVRIESRGAYLTASATDRYRVGISRIKPPSTPPAGMAFNIGLAELKRILSIFKSTRHSTPALRLTVKEATLRVEQVGGFEGFSDASITFPLVVGDFPRLAPLVANHSSVADKPAPTVALNSKYLAAFQHAARSGDPIIVRSANRGKPIIVTAGDYFIGALMPVKDESDMKDTHLADWIELFGDDAKPATDKAA